MKDLKEVFDYCKTTTWEDDTPDEVVCRQAEIAVKQQLAEKNYTKAKMVYRLAGQSGCGKTTQLLPTVMELEKISGNIPFVIAVRNFVKYHPRYCEIAATCEKGEIREKTNGFALKCFCAALKKVVELGILTIVDITILAPQFEEFINKVIKDNRYEVQYHLLAVNKKQSDAFIEKRRKDIAGAEKGKIVKQESKDYFYDILPFGVEYLSKVDTKSECFVWTAYDKEPIYKGKLDGACEAIRAGREKFQELVLIEDELREAKLQFMKGLLKKVILIFDFDGTLTNHILPNYEVLEKLGYPGGLRGEKFRVEYFEYKKQMGRDNARAMLHLIMKILDKSGIGLEEFCFGHETIQYNPGVDNFFKAIPAVAAQRNVCVKNYIITGGFVEFVNKLDIAKYFEKIYGSSLSIDENQKILGLKDVMTDAGKVEAIKEILRNNGRDEKDCSNVIIFGDGLTDRQGLQFVHENSGKAVLVHHQGTLPESYEIFNKDGIIDYYLDADFSEGKEIFKVIAEFISTL